MSMNILSNSGQLHNPLFIFPCTSIISLPFYFFPQNPACLPFHCCTGSNIFVSQRVFSTLLLCQHPLSGEVIYQAAQKHTPFFKRFLLYSRIPLFLKAWICPRQIHELSVPPPLKNKDPHCPFTSSPSSRL